jgi:hypothetical protein
MAIILPGGFNITNNEPSDARFSVANATARYALSSANIYEGLTVYEQDTNTGNSFSGSTTIGSDLLNIHNITGSVNVTGSLSLQNSNLEVTGSLSLNLSGVSKYFNISIDGEEKLKVNNEGVLQLFSQSSAPTPVEGGLYYGNDHTLYLGTNN